MNIIVGYLTNPILSDEEFIFKRNKLIDLGLDTKVFNEGIRRGFLIGPKGLIFSGEANLNSLDIFKVFYGKEVSADIKGLTYDISSFLKEDFNGKKLSFQDFNAYFSLRVKIDNERRILDFNKDYLKEYPKINFRYVDLGHVAYDYLVYNDFFFNEFKDAKRNLLRANLKLLNDESTFIKEFF